MYLCSSRSSNFKFLRLNSAPFALQKFLLDSLASFSTISSNSQNYEFLFSTFLPTLRVLKSADLLVRLFEALSSIPQIHWICLDFPRNFYLGFFFLFLKFYLESLPPFPTSSSDSLNTHFLLNGYLFYFLYLIPFLSPIFLQIHAIYFFSFCRFV